MDIIPFLNDCAFSFLLPFLVSFCGFFPISFDNGDVSNQLVNASVNYSFEDESEINYYALVTSLSHTA